MKGLRNRLIFVFKIAWIPQLLQNLPQKIYKVYKIIKNKLRFQIE